MPRVVISGQAARRFTGGQTEFEVEANNFRRMVLELDRRYPGLGRQIEESMAVAIDGEIFQDAYLAPLNPESEIYLIPKSAAADRAARLMTTPARGGEHRGETADRFHSSGCPAARIPGKYTVSIRSRRAGV